MNVTVYLFGEFNSRYSQYPDDYASNIFTTFNSHAKSTTQVAIHRDGNLMYYGYIRKLENDRYIGLCAVLNGLYLTKIDGLFSLYENMVSNLIANGRLIHFNERGEVVSSVEKLYVHKEEIDLITESLRAGFYHLNNCAAKLPAVNYGKSKDSIEDFSVDDDRSEIVKSSYQNGYTFIYKSKDFNTTQLNSYREVLARISDENASLKKERTELQEKLLAVQRQKKQIKNVILLILVVIGCSIGIYLLNKNLYNTQGQLAEANDTIQIKNTELQKGKATISSLHISLDSLQQICNNERNAREKVEDKLENISKSAPFIATNCNVSSTWFSFDYYTTKEKKITVTLKAINENNSEVISNTHTLTLYEGTGYKKLNFHYKLDSSCFYYVVLMYDGKIIAGKRW